jgi:nitroimidazol reductase NimA-like FMN-containing flavoprotein (pyridoxamine 5'-phosphate oxidase superfamily)
METLLNEDWTADVVGRMHKCRISNVQLAEECNYSAAYLSTVLNGNKVFENDDAKRKTKDRIIEGLTRLESKILSASEEQENANGSD